VVNLIVQNSGETLILINVNKVRCDLSTSNT